MKKTLIMAIAMLAQLAGIAQNAPDKAKIKQDLDELLSDLASNYVYLQKKNVDLGCIRQYYTQQIDNIKTEEQTVLLFEFLLDEFYDSHLILNTNRNSSYRLSSPLYAKFENGRAIITNIWQSQVENWDADIVGAEILRINGISVDEAINAFPTHCSNKSNAVVREWILNKVLAGRYDQPRILALKLRNRQTVDFDLDKIKLKKNTRLVNAERRNDVGIIRINNSLGNNDLVTAFDKALDSLFDTKAMIVDLRNTVDGGNSYVARGIMSRFINTTKAYQKHVAPEQYNNNPNVERTWIEYVNPRGKTYSKPVIVLIDRWTGSMGEGIAVGFEGIGRGTLVGTEMERLAGEMEGFSFPNQKFGYRISTAKLYHVNGLPREDYVPANYVKQTTVKIDEILESALRKLK